MGSSTHRAGRFYRSENRLSGWVSFASWLVIVIGGISFFEGLIAVIRWTYYVLIPEQIVVFNVKTWGWIVLILGVVLVLAGLALLARADGPAGSQRSLAVTADIYTHVLLDDFREVTRQL